MPITTKPRHTLTVRDATPADAPELFAMIMEIAEHENAADAVRLTQPRLAELLAEPTVTVLLAEAMGELVGYVSAVRQLNLWRGEDILALDDLYVRPGQRDRGVGERLMRALAGRVAGERLLIRWEMLADNHGGQRFYRRLGANLRTKVIATWPVEAYASGGSAVEQHQGRRALPSSRRPE